MSYINWNNMKGYKVMLGINKSEFEILFYLINSGKELSIKQIMDYLPRDRTTIQKIVKNLVVKGYLTKKKYSPVDVRNLEDANFKTGYKYAYFLNESCFTNIIKPFIDTISELEELKNILLRIRKEYMEK